MFQYIETLHIDMFQYMREISMMEISRDISRTERGRIFIFTEFAFHLAYPSSPVRGRGWREGQSPLQK